MRRLESHSSFVARCRPTAAVERRQGALSRDGLCNRSRLALDVVRRSDRGRARDSPHARIARAPECGQDQRPSGLHILVPLAPGHTFEQAESLGRGIATLLVKRGGKLLVDHKQFMAKTLVAPYSLRSADGGTVSAPIAWSEVTRVLDPKQFTLRTVRARLDAYGDLAAPLVAGNRATLATALAQLQHR